MKPFEGLFGNTAETRLIQFLLGLEDMPFTKEELAQEMEVSEGKAEMVIKTMLRFGVLKEKSGYYIANKDSEILKAVEDINNVLISILYL